MSTHKVIFHNFPSCSMLMDEIITNNKLGTEVEFINHTSSQETIAYIKENPRTFLIFYNDSPKDYIAAKSMLKQLMDFFKRPVDSMAIVSNSDPMVQKSLKELGVKDIFSLNYHSSDIIEKLERHLLKRKAPKKPQPKSKQETDENIFNLVVDKNDYRQEEFSQVISETAKAQNINLDSGKMAIDLGLGEKDNHIECSLENFEAGEVEIAMEGKTDFKTDDPIELNIIFQYNRCKVELMIDGVVQENEKTSESGCVLTIKLNNDESISLENFMSLYQQRQKNIDDFMIMAKGL